MKGNLGRYVDSMNMAKTKAGSPLMQKGQSHRTLTQTDARGNFALDKETLGRTSPQEKIRYGSTG